MLITDYTSYAEVRSVIGLSTDELTDTQLALEVYANSLELYLGTVTLPTEAPGPGPLSTRFLEIKGTAVGERTTKEQLLYALTRLLSTYVVASEVAISLSMTAPKMISDSKVSLTRFAPEATFRDVATAIRYRVSELKGRIEDINITTAASLPYMTAVVPSFDVVDLQ